MLKKVSYGGRKKGKVACNLWVDKALADKLGALARQAGEPRSLFMENELRKALGLPTIGRAPNTPRHTFSD